MAGRQKTKLLGQKYACIAVLLALLGAVSSCGSLTRTPVPVDRISAAQVPEMPGIRSIGLQHSPDFQADLVRSVNQEGEDVYCRMPDGSRGYCVLALSGGGSLGAFGAGFLNGWTEAGTRPAFKLVTGVSTGAIMAPFAFLGPEYDRLLKKFYTTIKTSDILIFRGIIMAVLSESFAETGPFANLIKQYIDDELLQAIAAAHSAGRRLYVGTTNMDAQRFIIWNMGAIAKSGGADALQLFRDVILASASIPAAFPPVFINVEVDGQRYDEMHADGGTMSQVFFIGNVVDLKAAREAAGRPSLATGGRIYVIRNAHAKPEPTQVKRTLQSVTSRAVSTMIKSMGLSDLYRIYAKARARGIDYNYVDIPVYFVWQGKEEFDRAEMNRLYEVGSRLAKSGGGWSKTPPYFDPADWPASR